MSVGAYAYTSYVFDSYNHSFAHLHRCTLQTLVFSSVFSLHSHKIPQKHGMTKTINHVKINTKKKRHKD